VYQNSIFEQSLHTYERQRHTNSMIILCSIMLQEYTVLEANIASAGCRRTV